MNFGGLLFYSAFFLLNAFWIGALIDVGMTEHAKFAKATSNKGMIMLLLVLTGWLGSLYWLLVMRRRVKG